MRWCVCVCVCAILDGTRVHVHQTYGNMLAIVLPLCVLTAAVFSASSFEVISNVKQYRCGIYEGSFHGSLHVLTLVFACNQCTKLAQFNVLIHVSSLTNLQRYLYINRSSNQIDACPAFTTLCHVPRQS